MGVTDRSGKGLKKIRELINVNARLTIPPLPPNTTYVRVIATRVDPTKPARSVIEACTECGTTGECCGKGDPVLTTLEIPEGRRRVRDTFADIPKVERYITVQNGTPGLRRLRVTVNGLTAGSLRLPHGEAGMLDVRRYMLPEKNIFTLTGEGVPGSAALVIISDVPAPEEGASSSYHMIQWDAGPAKAGHNLHWGR